MRRAAFLALVAAAVGAAAAFGATHAGGQVREVSMPGKVFVPGRADALVGDTVVWRNADAVTHTVTSNDDVFDSGYLAPGATFAWTFTKPGLYAYHCSIHKFMRGVVRVVAVALSASSGQAVVSGGRIVLTGLAPTGTAKVVLSELGGTLPDRTVTPSADGSFALPVRVFRPASFRAVVGGSTSPVVRIAVAPVVRVEPGAGALAGTVAPSRAGARAVLQRYDREHFAWLTVARGRVDAGSHVAIALPADRRGRFRVVVRGDHGWADGASQSVVLG